MINKILSTNVNRDINKIIVNNDNNIIIKPNYISSTSGALDKSKLEKYCIYAGKKFFPKKGCLYNKKNKNFKVIA